MKLIFTTSSSEKVTYSETLEMMVKITLNYNYG